MGQEIEKAAGRTAPEIVAYLSTEITKHGADRSQIHIHYHATPSTAPPAVPVPETRPDIATRMVPYFVVLLGGMIILAGVGAITVLLVPAIMSLAVTLAAVAGGIAIMFVAVAAAVRSLRQTGTDHRIMDQRMKATRRRR